MRHGTGGAESLDGLESSLEALMRENRDVNDLTHVTNADGESQRVRKRERSKRSKSSIN